jgi:type II secretory pathway predicted ATPase ExeA
MTITTIAHPVMTFYGFSRMPFDKDFACVDAFNSPSLGNAVAMLALGVESEDLLLVSGPIGCGKSVALRSFLDSLDPNRFSPIYLRGLGLSPADLVKSILLALLVEPPYNYAKARALYFKTVAEHPRKPIIVIDDAQDMKESALLSVKNLVNFNSDSKSKITFVLCGQPELKETLRYARLSSVHQRIRHWVEFSGLSLKDTCEYIDHAVALAGRPTPIFSDNAKAEIHKRSLGIPRRINRICLRTLFEGAAQQRAIIDEVNIVSDDV